MPVILTAVNEIDWLNGNDVNTQAVLTEKMV